MGIAQGLFKSLRPKQWTKNLLLFAGVVFTRSWSDPLMLRNAVAAFAIFCGLSSVVYLVNDIFDVEKDRQHPKKKFRPIAAGVVSVPMAWALAVLMTVGGLWAAFSLTRGFGIIAALYLGLSFGYSVYLKHVAVADILVLAVGFVLRALGGIEAIHLPGTQVQVTSFFLLTTLFLALFLAICKRRNELVTLGDEAANHRQVLGEYSVDFLNVLLTVATTGTIFSYALWTTQGQFAEPQIQGHFGMVFTIPFVLYGIFRYVWLVYRRDEGGAPEVLLLTDIPLLISVLLWGITVVAILYNLPVKPIGG
jgi:4-hydroxybenzoate polyprenyltransferase